MNRYIQLLLLCALWLQMTPSIGCAAGITNYPKLNTPEFWTALSPENDAIVMSPKEIDNFNHKIVLKSASVYDLTEYPAALPASRLKEWLSAADLLEDTLYSGGAAVNWQYKQTLLTERNLEAIPEKQPVVCGVTVRRANLRALPTASGLFEDPDGSDFDILQETAVDPSEPLLILHTSKSGEFKYVQMRNYRGWMASRDIAETSAKEWLNYVDPEEFLVVVDKSFTLEANGEQIFYQMGAKIPLLKKDGDDYIAAVPARTAEGQLAAAKIRISVSEAALHEGFLPYTRNQIIRQSFKFLHAPYGWGGLKNSVDCSSFIADVYRSVGIELPRNADEQEFTAGIRLPFNQRDGAERAAALHNLQSGDALFFNGHTMLYLGETNHTPFIIHALGSHTRHYTNGTKEKIQTMKVIVSDLSLQRYSGITFADALRSAMSYQSDLPRK